MAGTRPNKKMEGRNYEKQEQRKTKTNMGHSFWRNTESEREDMGKCENKRKKSKKNEEFCVGTAKNKYIDIDNPTSLRYKEFSLCHVSACE